MAAALELIVARERSEGEAPADTVARAAAQVAAATGESEGEAVARAAAALWHLNPESGKWERTNPVTGAEETSEDPFSSGIGTELARRADALWASDEAEEEDGGEERPGMTAFQCHTDYEPEDEEELGMKAGDTILVWDMDDSGWWEGRNERTGDAGWLPMTYVTPLNKPDDLQESSPPLPDAAAPVAEAKVVHAYESVVVQGVTNEPYPVGTTLVVVGMDDDGEWLYACAKEEQLTLESQALPRWVPANCVEWEE